MPQTVSQAAFIDAWHRHGGSPSAIADALGIAERNVYARRERLAKQDIRLETKPHNRETEWTDKGWTFPREERVDIHDGVVVISSDHHYFPGSISIAHKALISVIRQLKPVLKIANGDIFDGASISRHDSFGWGNRPSPVQELHECQERLGEVEQAIPNGCKLVWNVGNHDVRWERTLAAKVGEFEGLFGLRLADHFPAWDLQWSTLINPDTAHPVMVKHRFQSAGIHASYNATLKAGISTVSGHTHLLDVKAWGDYRGRRYGIQTGSLANLDSSSFEYAENNPTAACSGFVVLTFKDGRLLHPEFCEVIDGRAFFRGDVVAE